MESDCHTRADSAEEHDSITGRLRSRLPSEGCPNISGTMLRTVLFVGLLSIIAVDPVSAQQSVGSVYCDTAVEAGIDMVFGAIAGLGLPVTLLYIARGGVNYMRAGGRPQRKDDAREQVVMAGVGFGVVLLALAAPELIDKFGSQLGFGFSDCVQPF